MLRRSLRFLLALVVLLLLYAGVRSVHVLRSAHDPMPAEERELRELGVQAIASGDVPVSSLLLYNERIIGRGFNTVLRDGNAGGHAEVNAVTDAMRTMGREAFNTLDRDSLLLVTTYEPCAMCRGMLLEYRIGRVAFIEPKSLFHWMREDLRWLGYELTKQPSGPAGLQDSLFRLHPKYPGR